MNNTYHLTLDDIYSSLMSEFKDNDNLQVTLDLIDELQAQIEDLK
jgi:hypothetical protein